MDYSKMSRIELLKLNEEYISKMYTIRSKLNNSISELAQKNNIDLANMYREDITKLKPNRLVVEIQQLQQEFDEQMKEKELIIDELNKKKF